MAEDTGKPAPGGTLFAALFLAFALFLLSVLGEEAEFSAKGVLYAQPAFWPAIGVFGMVVFGAAHLVLTLRTGQKGDGTEALFWLRSGEYLLWFMVYVQAVPYIGYLPATLIFCPFVAWRAGYRRPRMLLIAALSGFAIVFVFKALLAVKIPGGALYEHLPDALRTFMIANF